MFGLLAIVLFLFLRRVICKTLSTNDLWCVTPAVFVSDSRKAASVLKTCNLLYVACVIIMCFGMFTSLFNMFISSIWKSLFGATRTKLRANYKVVWLAFSFVCFMTTASELLSVINTSVCGPSVNLTNLTTTIWQYLSSTARTVDRFFYETSAETTLF